MADYDNLKVFNYVLNAVKSLGFVDTTSPNDFCPSITRELPSGSFQKVFIDYANPELREDPACLMFDVSTTDKEGYEEPGYDFSVDDADELIEALEQRDV
tara:strand:+ start:101 stop:400 length:300 start_codon:yes stop_codon:yes gene_type:complete